MADALDGPCWCTTFAPVVAVPGVDASCWCPACLTLYIEAQKSSLDAPPHD
ncbi:MAG: hypothetical protein WKG03_09485 [Telluria sp.]